MVRKTLHISTYSETYESALDKTRQAEATSNLESENDEEVTQCEKRPPRRYMSESDEGRF